MWCYGLLLLLVMHGNKIKVSHFKIPVQIRHAVPGPDDGVQGGIGEGGVVELIVAPPPETDQVNKDVLAVAVTVAGR